IIVEVPTADDIQDIPTEADVEIDWLVRGSIAPGESRLMYEAVKSLSLPAGRTFAWCAGETLTIAPIRRYLRRDLGLPTEDVEVVGYWRKMPTTPSETRVAEESAGAGSPGEASAAASPSSAAAGPSAAGSAPDDSVAADTTAAAADAGVPAAGASEGRPEPEGARDALHQVHQRTELLPPIITRPAVTRALGLLTREEQDYRNTPAGAVLTADGAADGLDLSSPALLDLFSLVDLIDVLKGGFTARTSRASAAEADTWHDQRAADAALDTAHRGRSLDHLQYVLDPILDLEPVTAAASLALAGDVDAEAAAALTRRAPESGRTIHTPAAQALAGGEDWPSVDC